MIPERIIFVSRGITVLSYCSEAMLAIYEGKILPKVFGPVSEKGSGLYVGPGVELCALFDVPDIVKYI